MKFGTPLSLSGSAFQQGQYDVLLPPTPIGTISSPGITQFIVTAVNTYTAIAVTMNTQGAWWIQVSNSTAINEVLLPSASSGLPLMVTNLTMVLPVAAVAGDQLIVNIFYGGPPPMGGGNTAVLGLTSGYAQSFRADNRAYPSGYANALFVGAGPISNAALVNPSANYRLMLKSLNSSTTAPAGVQVSVNTFIGGNAATLLRDAPPGFSTTREWVTGLLLDPNAGINYTVGTSAAFMSFNVEFDYVPN